MAFVRSETGSGGAAPPGWASPRSSRLARWAIVSGTATLLAFLSLSALAGLVFLATSLTSPTDFAPHAQKAATADRLALAAALYSPPARQTCPDDCRQRTQYIVQQAKTSRNAAAVDKHIDMAAEAVKRRFAEARASLTREKMASALAEAHAGLATRQAPLPAPIKERLYPAARVAALPDSHGPAASRFGPRIPEIERSSRLALALAGSGTLHVSYPVHTASLGPVMPLLAPQTEDEPADIAAAPAFEQAPQSAPLPASRPKPQVRQPAAVAEAAPAPRRTANNPSPTRRGSDQQALAYAAPDDGAPSVGQAFKNLFSSPGAGNGVAVYDISAQTVTMPDGSVLEAHSGIGHMADDPRYVSQKMNGPTPPNTYKLVMRESRFYGVEAIRMLPTEPGRMHGRNGILAHSYLLRGRTAQSHGCVAFADYDRFLKAFKQGKVKHMVVVPGRGKSSTRIAKNGRGA